MTESIKLCTNHDMSKELNDFKLSILEKVIDIKCAVLKNISAEEYIKHYETIMNIEEELIKLVYNYIDIKHKFNE